MTTPPLTPTPTLDLTPIRHRLAPKPRRTALEEARLIEQIERSLEVERALAWTALIVAGVTAVAWGLTWLVGATL